MEFVINFIWNVPKWTRNGILNTHHHLFATEECACESQCAFSSKDQIFRQNKLARLYLHHPATCNSLVVHGGRRGALQVTCRSAASRPAERLPWDWQTPAAQAHLMRKDWPSLTAGESQWIGVQDEGNIPFSPELSTLLGPCRQQWKAKSLRS